MRWVSAVGVVVLLGVGGTGWAQTGRLPGLDLAERVPVVARLANAQEIRTRLGLVPEYDRVPGIGSVKVAVLDYGFDGLGNGRPYLPKDAVVVEHYDPEFVRRFGLGDPEYRKPFDPFNRHGRVMAQIVWAVTGSRPEGPKFYLLNANGPTMLRRAVRYAIEQKVDVILFSGSFEGGGNGDGRGPIDRVVADALAAGILWVNASGNYGGRVYNGPVRVLRDGYLRLRDGSDIASLRFRNHVDENTVTVTLTWNDYREQEDAGTSKDLDLYIEDWTGRRVGEGTKVQVMGPKSPGPEESLNPRERIVLTDLAASPDVPSDPEYAYRIRVRARGGRFDSNDRIRILVTSSRDAYMAPGREVPGPALEFLDATNEGEIYPPADHPLVLTVGDADPSSSLGPTLDRRVKPDAIVEDSRAFFTDGLVLTGSSNAAAYVAGVVTVLRASAPNLRPAHLLRLAQQGTPVTAKSLRGQGPATTTVAPPPTSPPTATPTPTPTSLTRTTVNATAPPRRTTTGSIPTITIPVPPTPGVSRPWRPTATEFRIWKTPTRAKLAEVLRGGR